MRRAHASAVVVAAGAGSRLGGGEPKALLTIGGRMMVAVAVGAMIALRRRPRCRRRGSSRVRGPREGSPDRAGSGDHGGSGGPSRQASVAAGLAAVDGEAKIVVIHDAARPFASAALFTAVIQAVASGADAALPVLPLTDTVKRVRDGLVVDTEPREELALAQTPRRRGWSFCARPSTAPLPPVWSSPTTPRSSNGPAPRCGSFRGGRQLQDHHAARSPARATNCSDPAVGDLRVGLGFDVHPRGRRAGAMARRGAIRRGPGPRRSLRR